MPLLLPSPCMHLVYLTNFIWHSTSNPKCHVAVFINKNECRLTSTFSSSMSPQCHMPSSTCHFNFLACQLTCGSFLPKSHYMSNSQLCVSIDKHFYFFLGKFLCVSNVKNFVKNTHWCAWPSFPVGDSWGSIGLLLFRRWSFLLLLWSCSMNPPPLSIRHSSH